MRHEFRVPLKQDFALLNIQNQVSSIKILSDAKN